MGSALEESPAKDHTGWSTALTGGLLAGCIVVPCLFTTRLEAVFVVPKLAALWALLAFSLAVISGWAVFSGTRFREARPLPLDVAVGVFVVLNLTAWALSADRPQSLYGERLQYQGLLTLLLYVGFFYIARLALTDEGRLRLLGFAVAIGATVVAGYALVQRAGLDPIWEGYLPAGRVFSSIGQPNALAAYLALAVPFAASLLLIGRMLRGAILVAGAGMSLALLLTLSRAGYLAFAVALAILAVSARERLKVRARRISYGVAATLIAGLTIAALLQPARATVRESWQRVSSSTNSGEVSLRFHLDAWRVASRMIVEHPLVGTGQERFPDLFPRYSHAVLPLDRAASLDAFRVESPHNVYLAIAAGAGLPAFIAYAAIIAGVAFLVTRAVRTAQTPQRRLALVAVLAALSAHLVTDAFMTADVSSTWLFWVLLGAGVAVSSNAVAATQPLK